MATVYFTASSVDGFVVDEDNSLDWLLSRDIDPTGPFGYQGFLGTVGVLVMGATTYEWIIENQPGEWPYAQPTWVLTNRPEIVVPGHPVTTYHGDVAELHPELLKSAGYQDVWVVGGGVSAAQFVRAGLVDELIVTYAPCSLGSGRPLLPTRSEWFLADSGVNGEFLCARWRKG